jgi:hypothetical protein
MNEAEKREDEFERKTKDQPHLESLKPKSQIAEDDKGGVDG